MAVDFATDDAIASPRTARRCVCLQHHKSNGARSLRAGIDHGYHVVKIVRALAGAAAPVTIRYRSNKPLFKRQSTY
jgi:hypothetical protein